MITNVCGSKLMQGSGRARAVLLVSHGSPSAPEAQDGEMAELAEAIAALRPDWRVEAATLAVPGAFEARLDAMPGALIVPLFMASGWFVSTALPKRIGARAAQLLPPLGACEGVATLFAQELRHHLDQRGWVGAETALLLGAHGSQKSPANAIAAQTMGARLQAELGLRRVAVGADRGAARDRNRGRKSGTGDVPAVLRTRRKPCHAGSASRARQDRLRRAGLATADPLSRPARNDRARRRRGAGRGFGGALKMRRARPGPEIVKAQKAARF